MSGAWIQENRADSRTTSPRQQGRCGGTTPPLRHSAPPERRPSAVTWRDVTGRSGHPPPRESRLQRHRLPGRERRRRGRPTSRTAGSWSFTVHRRSVGCPRRNTGWSRDVRETIPPSDLAARAARLRRSRMGGVVEQRIQVIAVDGVTTGSMYHKALHDDDGRPDGSTGSLVI